MVKHLFSAIAGMVQIHAAVKAAGGTPEQTRALTLHAIDAAAKIAEDFPQPLVRLLGTIVDTVLTVLERQQPAIAPTGAAQP